MSFMTAMYEGDSVIRFAPHATGTTAHGTVRTGGLARPVPHRVRHGAIKVLFGAVWNALKSAVLWLDEKSREGHYRRIEAYLAQSTDHADLERRLRDLERGNQLYWTDCGSR